MSSVRVLIVEDNRDNMTLVTDMLEALGYVVIPARDGQSAITMAVDTQPDLILLDMSLPIVDGWTAARELKGRDETRAIPIIALTAHAMGGDRERALAAGCDDYVAKPINMPELINKMRKHLVPRDNA